MPSVSLPPWLGYSPEAPVQTYLSAVNTGERLAAGSRAAQAQADEMQFRREQAAEANRIKEQQQQLDAAQLGIEIRTKQQAAERAAAEAAIQLEGQQGLEKDLAAGEPIEKAFPKWAPKLLYKHPQSIAPSIKAIQPPGTPQPGWTPSGVEYMTDPRGGVHFPPGAGRAPFPQPTVQELGPGVSGVQVSPQKWQIINKPKPPGMLTDIEKIRLKGLTAQEKAAQDLLDKTPSASPNRPAREALLKAIQAKIEAIENPPVAAPPAAAITPSKSIATQKAELANQLFNAHPDWKREKVIEEVNKTFKPQAQTPSEETPEETPEADSDNEEE